MKKLIDKINKYYFLDEDGCRMSGHPDELAVSIDTVLEDFPDASKIKVISLNRIGSGYSLPDGVWLFPYHDVFIKIITIS